MDQQQLSEQELTQLTEDATVATEDSIPQSPDSETIGSAFEDIRKILAQRQEQRRLILGFVAALAIISLIGLFGLIGTQAMIRYLNNPDYMGVSDTVIEALITGVFAQIIGILSAISIALWKDKDYLDYFNNKK